MAAYRLAQKLALSTTLIAAPALAWAQGQPSAPVSAKLPPGLTLSVAFGPAPSVVTYGDGNTQSRGPVVSGSVDVALNRFVIAQAEVFSWREQSSRTSRGSAITGTLGTGYTGDWVFNGRARNTAIVGNFLGRFGAGRFHGNAGMGFGVVRERQTTSHRNVGCVPHFVGACNGLAFGFDGWTEGFAIQFLAGLDVAVTPRLTAFANIRAVGHNGTASMVTGGVRWTVRRAPVGPTWRSSANPATAASAIGKAVHVESFDRSRQNGELVSLTATHVTIRNMAGDVTLPLSEVRGIRKQTRAILKGAIAGVIAGLATGLTLCTIDGGCDGEGVVILPMMMGIGAGAGTGVGAIVNLSTADARTIYVSPSKSAFVVAPILGKQRAGIGARIAW